MPAGWGEPRRWDAGQDWPYDRPVVGPALVDDAGRVVQHRAFEGAGGRPVVMVQEWAGGIEDYTASTGSLPAELAPWGGFDSSVEEESDTVWEREGWSPAPTPCGVTVCRSGLPGLDWRPPGQVLGVKPWRVDVEQGYPISRGRFE